MTKEPKAIDGGSEDPDDFTLKVLRRAGIGDKKPAAEQPDDFTLKVLRRAGIEEKKPAETGSIASAIRDLVRPQSRTEAIPTAVEQQQTVAPTKPTQPSAPPSQAKRSQTWESDGVSPEFGGSAGTYRDPLRPEVDSKSRPPYGALSLLGDAGRAMSASLTSGLASTPKGVADALTGAAGSVLRGETTDSTPVMRLANFARMALVDAIGLRALKDQIDDKQKADIAVDSALSSVSVPGVEALADYGNQVRKNILAGMSEEGKKRMAGAEPKGNIFKGEFSWGDDPTVAGYALQAAGVFGSLAPVVVTALATRNPSAAAAVGGGMAAGEGAGAAKEYIDKLSHQQLLEVSPYYKAMVDREISPDQARSIVTARAGQTAAMLQGMVAALGSNVTGKLVTGAYDDLLYRVGGRTAAGRAVATGGVGALEEGVQEVGEGVAADVGIRSQIKDKEIGEGSAANLVLGAIGGGTVGAVRGAIPTPVQRLAGEIQDAVDQRTFPEAGARREALRSLDPNQTATAVRPEETVIPRSLRNARGEPAVTPRGGPPAIAITSDRPEPTLEAGVVATRRDEPSLGSDALASAETRSERSLPQNVAGSIDQEDLQGLLNESDARAGAQEPTTIPREETAPVGPLFQEPDTFTNAIAALKNDLGVDADSGINATRVTSNKTLNAFGEALSTAFGTNVHWVDFGKDGLVATDPNGQTRNLGAFGGYRFGKTVLIGADANFMDTVWHEITHVLETEHPDIYKPLRDVIAASVDPEAQRLLFEKLNESRMREVNAPMSEQSLDSELVAYSAGEQLTNPKLLKRVFDSFQDKTLAQRFKDILVDIFEKLSAALRGPQFVKDRKKIRDVQKAIVTAFAEYQKREAERAKLTPAVAELVSKARPAASPVPTAVQASPGTPQVAQAPPATLGGFPRYSGYSDYTSGLSSPKQPSPYQLSRSPVSPPSRGPSSIGFDGTASTDDESGQFARTTPEQETPQPVPGGAEASETGQAKRKVMLKPPREELINSLSNGLPINVTSLLDEPDIFRLYSEIKTLLRRAVPVKIVYDNRMLRLAQREGMGVKAGPVKSFPRSFSKIWEDYEGDHTRIADIVRSTFVVNELGELDDMIRAVLSFFPGSRLKRNGWDRSAPVHDSGYRDVMFAGVFISGFPVEMQMNFAPMLRAKDTAHGFYKQADNLRRAMKSTVSPMTPGEMSAAQDRIRDLELAQADLYFDAADEVFDRANRSRQSSSDILSDSNVQVDRPNIRGAFSPVAGLSSQARMPPLGPRVRGMPLQSKKDVPGGNLSGIDATSQSPRGNTTDNIPQERTRGQASRRLDIGQGAEEQQPQADRSNPLLSTVSAEDAEGRIARRLKRKEGVGAPKNERVEFESGSRRFITGRITPEDWLGRVKRVMTTEEMKEARAWYQQLEQAFQPVFGDKTARYALSWLLSQQNASPTLGLMAVLRAADLAAGKQKIKTAGLNEEAIVDVLSERTPRGGIGAKLMDFLDSELGRKTRTIVRDDPRGRQPAAIDVWAQRDVGFVDKEVKDYIRKKFGEAAADSLTLDKTTSGEAQYEYGIDVYNNIVEYLNGLDFDGGGWEAREVQAVGWVAMQRDMGVRAEFVKDIIAGNTRRISIGLKAGDDTVLGNVLAGKEIPLSVVQKEIDYLASLSGIRVRKSVVGVGAYMQSVEGSIQVDALTSPEAVADFMDMVGYAFQQTEIISTRSLKSGKNMAIDVMSPDLRTADQSAAFFLKFLEKGANNKKGEPLAPGMQQIEVGDAVGIRLLNFDGNWRQTQLAQIREALTSAADDLGIKLESVLDHQVELSNAKNVWKDSPNGEQYLDSLRNRGRLQEVELLQRRYPPSRVDIAGDGTIFWEAGAAKRVLRLDQPPIRSSTSSGRVLGEAQPGASSFIGIHYGNARTETLAGSRYGSGIKGAEARRLANSEDPRIKRRVFFYIQDSAGNMPRAEAGLGQYVYSQQLDNILGPGEDMSRLFREAGRDGNTFESSVVDAGYDGYAVPNMGMMVVLNHDVPVDYEGTRTEVNRRIEDGIEVGDPSRAGQFNRQLVEFAATGDPRAPDLFGIARTFPVLLAVGAPEQLLIMDKKVVAKVVDPPSAGKSTEDTVRRSESGLIVPVKARIPLTVDEIQSVPRQMADPVAIIRSVRDGSSGRRYGFKILIDLVKNGFPVVVIYHPSVKYETRERKHIVSQIASIYPANEESTLSEISRELTQEKLLVYYNKGKALALASKIGNKLPSLSKTTALGAKTPGQVPNRQFKPLSNSNFVNAKRIVELPSGDKVIQVNGREYPDRMNDEPETAEGTKKYMKRAIDKMPTPESLPFEPGRFFVMNERSELIPVENIVSAKTDEENKQGAANAPKRLLAAYDGILKPRDPIAVQPSKDGTFTVIDGNGTFTALKQYGWESIPANVYASKAAFEESEQEKSGAPASPQEGENQQVGNLARRVALRGSRFNIGERTRSERASNLLANEVSRVADVQRQIAAQGGVVTEETNIENALHRTYGRAGNRIEEFRKGVLRQIIDDAAQQNVNLDDVALYLYASHAQERNAYIQSINPKFPDGGSGMDSADAAAVLATLRKRGAGFQDIKNIADRLQRITLLTGRALLDGGLVDTATLANWAQSYNYYVPLKGFEQVDENGQTGNGRFDPRDPFFKKAKGRSSRAGQIIENIIRDYEEAIVAAEKNKLRQAFLKFVLQNPDQALWSVDPVMLQPRWNKSRGIVEYATVVDDSDKRTIGVRVSGVPRSIRVNDPAMLSDLQLQSVMSGQPEVIKQLFGAWSLINRTLAKLWTALSPAFVLINAQRDLQTALIASGIERGAGAVVDVARDFIPAAYSIMRAERNNSWGKNSKLKEFYDMYRADGGKTGFMDLRNLEQRQEQLLSDFRNARASIKDPRSYHRLALRYIQNAEDFIMDINSGIENAARVAAYKSVIEQAGYSPTTATKAIREEAAIVSKNLTVNFNRRGKLTPLLSSFYLFFNPAVQGALRTGKLVFSKKGGAVAGGLAALGYVVAMMAAGAKGDDDEPYWDKESNRAAKLKNLLFFGPSGEQYTVPLAYGLGFFVNLGYAMRDLQAGTSPLKVASFLRDSFFTHFSPLGAADNTATFLAPTLLDPAIVLSAERRENGTPLLPPDYSGTTPDSERYWTATRGTLLQKFTSWMNEATGGSAASPGGVSVSPERLAYLLTFATGGAGTFVKDIINSIDLTLNVGPDAAMDKNAYPLLKQFYKRDTGRGDQGAFFDNGKTVAQAKAELKLLNSEERPSPGVLKREGINESYAAIEALHRNSREQLSLIRKQEIQIMDSDSMSRREKYLALKSLDRERREIEQEFNREFYGIRKSVGDR